MDFFEKYSNKVIDLKKLKIRVGSFPRKKKIILCHGVFDVVHPGHVRHFYYTKKQSDILVVSCTADRFINKGIYRPHVPEKLRALNLAAYEMIDYVVIDHNKTPLNLINFLKPDYYAKGFEYSTKVLPKATQEEKECVEKYGGKIIFTPGDIVYSSSKIIDSNLPDLDLEKLDLLMKQNKISFETLKNILKQIKKKKVHVVGDVIVDTYSRTSFIGGQTKTPTFSVLLNSQENYVGGAAIVAMHLGAAGANVEFTSVVANDKLGKFVKNELKKYKIKTNFICEKKRPTTNKNTFISDPYRLLKVDTLSNSPIEEETINFISNKIKKNKNSILIFSDFRHGIFNSRSLPVLLSAIPKNTFKVGDSQVASRWGNISEFKKFDLITPNEKEARFVLGDQDSTVGKLVGNLIKKSQPKNLILKLGERGIFCKSLKKIQPFSIGSFTNEVIDPVGAGDAMLAYSALALYVSKSLICSSIIGSFAAALECEFDGNIPIATEKVLKKTEEIEEKIQLFKK